MKIKLSLLTFVLAFTASSYSRMSQSEVNTIVDDNGVSSNTITDEKAMKVIAEIGENGYSDAQAKALTGVARAQFGTDGSNGTLGTSAVFTGMFTHYTDLVKEQMLVLLTPTASNADRKEAANIILASEWVGQYFKDNSMANTGDLKNDINASKRGDGVTVLMAATNKEKEDIVDLLLALGADKTIKDNSSRNALTFATNKNNASLITKVS
jgi:hypothetical protein